MAYIPKSQIKENQFTSGYEWIYVKNNNYYSGFYYSLSNGKSYTGKNPNDPPNDEIIPSTPLAKSPYQSNFLEDEALSELCDVYEGKIGFGNQLQKVRDVQVYGILVGADYSLSRGRPKYSETLPTPEDYENGIFTRYFSIKTNQPNSFLEINKETYDYLNTKNEVWVLEEYIVFTLDWYIAGDIDRVFKNNKGLIFIKERSIKRLGLENYLDKKYLQYFLYPKASNLTTLGGELLYSDGTDYVGSYHIHPKQGPMEGPIHTSSPHQKLYYKKFYVGEIVNNLNQTGVVETGETQNIEYQAITSTDIPPPPTSSPTSGGSSTGGGY